ncbi:MAG: ATP-binding protein, partial [Burkholderiaceae bacterium]|nr:ATP-binding protein [Burkholderiaceae bacterium]
NGDAARLTQIVANLVDNALKFTPPGGDVMVGLEVRDGQAVLSVVDSGRGIDPEFLPGIFERFTQAAGAPGAGGGLGLGLAVARDLVRAHGGDIEVASEGRGRGARFTVRLPLAGREG